MRASILMSMWLEGVLNCSGEPMDHVYKGTLKVTHVNNKIVFDKWRNKTVHQLDVNKLARLCSQRIRTGAGEQRRWSRGDCAGDPPPNIPMIPVHTAKERFRHRLGLSATPTSTDWASPHKLSDWHGSCYIMTVEQQQHIHKMFHTHMCTVLTVGHSPCQNVKHFC